MTCIQTCAFLFWIFSDPTLRKPKCSTFMALEYTILEEWLHYVTLEQWRNYTTMT